MSDSLWSHGLQHARLPCPSPSPRSCSNSCTLIRWCHLTISSSVVPFSSCLQSFPVSGSFLMSWLFPSCGQSIRASASVPPMNIQDWFPLGLTGLISLQSKGLSRIFLNTTGQKHQFLGAQLSEIVISGSQKVQLSHPYMTTGKTITLTIWTFVGKVIFLLFNMLSRFVIAFLPRSKCLFYSDFGAQENKVCHCFHCFPIYLPWSDGTGCHDLSFLNVEFLSQLFHSPLSPSSRGSLVSLHYLP